MQKSTQWSVTLILAIAMNNTWWKYYASLYYNKCYRKYKLLSQYYDEDLFKVIILDFFCHLNHMGHFKSA